MKRLRVVDKKEKPILEMDITEDQALILSDAMRWSNDKLDKALGQEHERTDIRLSEDIRRQKEYVTATIGLLTELEERVHLLELDHPCMSVNDLEERVATCENTLAQWRAEVWAKGIAERVKKQEDWSLLHAAHDQVLRKRVARLEQYHKQWPIDYVQVCDRLARLERYVQLLEQEFNIPSPIPWGDLE